MNRDAQKTLFHPFETGAIAAPAKGARVLFLGAEPGFRPAGGLRRVADLGAGVPAVFPGACSAQAHVVTPRPEGQDFDGALVLAGRHRGQNEARIADAIERVVPGGLDRCGGQQG